MTKEAIPFDLNATGMIDLQGAASTKLAGGRYSLRRMLGRGGMGIVWLAQDERLQREVALKFLPPQIRCDAVALDELRRETARSQKLTHPNIVRIHDLYEAPDEDAFISMEYVDGSNLGTLRVQAAERVLAWSFLEPLVAQLCDALEYAHAEGIVHRDLKPANVMVDRAGRLKLGDFGIARAVTDTMSRSSISQTSGTLLYMSPQQLEGGLPRITDDIYGLGATLYELLTSKPPFFTGDLPHQVRNVAPRSLKDRLRQLELKNDIPAHVQDVILACLSKKESDRPNRAREVAQWLSSRQRPPGLIAIDQHSPRGLAVLAEAFKARPAWSLGAVGALAAIALTWAVLGHRHHKVAARDTAGNPRPAGSSAVGTVTPKADPAQLTPVVVRETSPPQVPKRLASKPARDFKPSPMAVPAKPAEPIVVVAATAAPVPPPLPEAVSPPQPEPAARSSYVAPPVAPAPLPPKPIARVEAPVTVPKSAPVVRAPEAARTVAKAPTALRLARQGNTHVSDRSKDQIVQIISSQSPIGSPPQEWRIIYYDAKALYKAVEVLFEGGQMTRIHEPVRILKVFTPQAQKPLDFARLKIDSDQALEIALALPGIDGVIVRSSQIELQRGYGGAPVWQVKLFGPGTTDPTADKALGYATILTDDGRVLKETLSKKLQQ